MKTIPFKLKLPKAKKVRRKLGERDPMKQSLGIHSSLSAIATTKTEKTKRDLKTRIWQSVTGSPEHNAYYDVVEIADLCLAEMTVDQLKAVLLKRK